MQLVSLGHAAAYRTMVDRYRAAWRRHQNTPGRLNPHVTTPRIGITRQVVIAPTNAEAEAIVRAVHPGWKESFVKLWAAHDDASVYQRVNLLDLEAAMRDEMIVWGTPERVRDQISRLIEVTDANYFVGCFAWGDLSLDHSLRSLHLFTDEVMPAF